MGLFHGFFHDLFMGLFHGFALWVCVMDLFYLLVTLQCIDLLSEFVKFLVSWVCFMDLPRNLVMPLRASNINYNDLRHIVLLGNINFIARWVLPIIWQHTGCSFPARHPI